MSRRLTSRLLVGARVLAPIAVAMGATVACSTPPSSGGSPSSNATPASPALARSTPALMPITRNLHPLAKPELDIGRRDPSILTAGSIYFQPTPAQKSARDSMVAAVSDPASPLFRKWITPREFAARFGAQASDIARVTEWLESQGLTIDAPSPLATRVGFRGTTGQVETAFHTEMHNYRVAGKTHYAMALPPQVPSELAPVIMGLQGFNDFHPLPVNRPRPKGAQPQFEDPGSGSMALGPADFRTLYDSASLINGGTDGTGINIAIIGQTYIDPSDIASFRSEFSIPSHETDICVPGSGDCHTISNNDFGEAELDLEWSSASAPGANILFVYTGGDYPDYSVNDSLVYVVEQGTNLAPGTGNGGAQIMSESYGGCDYSTSPVDADVYGEIAAAANLEGITYVAASGDSGSQGCLDFGIPGVYTGPPADMPGVTAVGGTEFCSGPPAQGFYPSCTFSTNPPNAQVLPYINATASAPNPFSALEYPQPSGQPSLEASWNDSLAFPGGYDYSAAGGGAPSQIFPKPFYQLGVTPSDGARDVPDVALTASPENMAFEVFEEGALPDGGGGFGGIGGTSAATPSFAGILAIVSQAVAAHGGPLGLGNVNPLLYQLQASASTTDAFHDIVTGDNTIACYFVDGGVDAGADPDCPPSGRYPGFSAGVGYDLNSGLGTIDTAKLVAAWSALTPTTTTVSVAGTATVGVPITISAEVSSTATSNPIGGTVTFTFETWTGSVGPVYGGDAGVPDESWVLGSIDVASASGTPEKATAQISSIIPPGLSGKAYIVAMYNGDTHYLASHSLTSLVTVSGSTLAVSPTSITLPPNGTTTFTATGGAPPVTWALEGTDTSCVEPAPNDYLCSEIVQESATTGFLQVGGQAGSVTIVAIDTNGEEATAKVTVSGVAVDAGAFPTFDAGAPGGPVSPPALTDSGSPVQDAGEDAGPPADAAPTFDAAPPIMADDSGLPVTTDAGEDGGSGGSGSGGGCSCLVAGSTRSSSTGSGGAALAGALFGIAVLGRRRSRRAGPTSSRAS